MFGYVTKRKALKDGMTHHGSYYGIPIWMQIEDEDFSVCAKWVPLDYLILIVSWAENIIRPIIFPDDDAIFQFRIGRDIGE
jgi:hypothetical protein